MEEYISVGGYMSFWSDLSPGVKRVVYGGIATLVVLLAIWAYGESDTGGTDVPRGIPVQSN